MVKISILQLKLNEENHNYCYASLRFLEKHNMKVDLNRYNVVYITERDIEFTNVYSYLDDLFEEFNIRHPKDFRGHSLSMSDIVKINDDYYYCDSYEWKKLSFKYE